MRNVSVRLTFSYRIGKMGFDNQPRQRRRKSVNNDDMKDGGGGDMDMGTQNQGSGNQGGGQRGNNGAAITIPAQQSKPTQPDSIVVPDSLSVDASGTWNYSLESPQGTTTGNFTLAKENGLYSGTITSARMNEPAELTSTLVTGKELITTYTMNFNGNSVPVTIKGTITDNSFEGTLSIGTFRTMPIKATRQ
jgi:hypothetical protein